MTTRSFREGEPFLLLTKTPPTFGRSLGKGRRVETSSENSNIGSLPSHLPRRGGGRSENVSSKKGKSASYRHLQGGGTRVRGRNTSPKTSNIERYRHMPSCGGGVGRGENVSSKRKNKTSCCHYRSEGYSVVTCLTGHLTIAHTALSSRGSTFCLARQMFLTDGGGVYSTGDVYSISCMAVVA